MRAEELLETLTDNDLIKKANDCFHEAETINPGLWADRQRLLTNADFYLKALARREDARVARRDFWMEVAVILLISIEIVLSVYGLREGHQQGKLIEKQTAALTHMDSSTTATADSLQKLIIAQDASLKILQEQQAEHAKKPKLALYLGKTPIASASVYLKATGSSHDIADLDLLVKNGGDAPVSPTRLHALTPEGVWLQNSVNMNSMWQNEPESTRFTAQLPLLPAGQTTHVLMQIYVPRGHSVLKISFTADAMELQTVVSLGSLTVLPPKKVE